MGSLLAALGDVRSSVWGELVRELTPVADWHDPASGVWLGATRARGFAAPVVSSTGLVAVSTGVLADGMDPARGVIDAYRRAGAAGLTELRGQYAFALWDSAERALWIATDAVGLHAPAYAWDGRTFLLCSQALLLQRAREGSPRWDAPYLAHAFGGLWSRTAAATAFQGIRRTVGGEILRASSRGLERLRGDQLTFGGRRPVAIDDAVDELTARLDRTVGAAVDDTPTCVAVSGGLDSCVVAAAFAARDPRLTAFSIVAPGGARKENQAVASVVAAFPGMRHCRVEVSTEVTEPAGSSAPFDDPICAGPVLQPSRVALLRAAYAAGFRRILDGEGGDELFDMAWWPRDLVREPAWDRLARALASRASRRLVVRDLAASGALGPASAAWEGRYEARLRADRPWLRQSFWESGSFAEAWAETRAYRRLRSAPERLREILGAHGKYWRAQSLVRRAVGVEGVSPLLDRTIVELVGSLPAAVVMDPRHRKALLRHVAARRVPLAVAWRAKAEPLSEWLVQRYVAADANVRRAADLVNQSEVLREIVDAQALAPAAREARRADRRTLASSLVEALLLVEWVTAVERYLGGQ